jgi:hypothetical protein
MTAKARKDTCSTCRFWREMPRKDIGECRRRAPTQVLYMMDSLTETEWPGTSPRMWCGEWEARP